MASQIVMDGVEKYSRWISPDRKYLMNALLYAYGERVFNLERAILTREGRRPLVDDDVAEYNYTQPVQTVFMNPNVLVPGPGDEVLTRKGMTLDRQVFKEMRREFYELRGWNPEIGEQPPRGTLCSAIFQV